MALTSRSNQIVSLPRISSGGNMIYQPINLQFIIFNQAVLGSTKIENQQTTLQMIINCSAKLSRANKFKQNQSTKITYQFGKITQYFRMWLNRIRFQDNRDLQNSIAPNQIQILQTPKQVQDKFIEHQQVKSVMEKQRMARIDQILGTRTYYHETKIFQERIDSDHLMQIEDLKKKHALPSRQDLNWQNPQAEKQYKVKNKRKFYKNMRLLREYPKHPQQIANFQNQNQQQVLDFLSKETLFTSLSLKQVDLSAKSLQGESVQNLLFQLQSRRFTRLYAYFSTQYSTSLFRIPQAKYTIDLISKIDKMEQLNEHIEPIVCLDDIYQVVKEYYHDERVSQYLKKVENGTIQYVVSGFEADAHQNNLVFWVDLLGNSQQYAFLYKSVKQNQGKLSKHVVYNCKAPAIFCSKGKYLYLVRRSQEGGFVQLIQKQVNYFQRQPKILFKCQAFEQMQIFKDKNNNFIFLKINEIGSNYKQKIYIIQEGSRESEEKQEQSMRFHLIPLTDFTKQIIQQQRIQGDNAQQKGKAYRHKVQICSKGLIMMKIFQVRNQFLKYGPNSEYARRIQLIPYKEHIQMVQQSKQRIGLQLPDSINLKNLANISAYQLDFSKRILIYQCPEEQFITEMSVKSSHILLNISSKSIYNRTRLQILPFSKASTGHSLVFEAQNLSFLNFGYDYNNQTCYFRLKKNLMQNFYYYTIWKRQISSVKNNRIYQQEIKVNPNLNINVICLDRYINLQKTRGHQFQLPVVLLLDDTKSTRNQTYFKKMLQKGVIIATLDCRGTYTRDLVNFHQGTGQNYTNIIKDIQAAIQYIGNAFSTNISLYAKGNYMAFIGLLLNIRHPFLFNSSVLHNGLFDLNDWTMLNKNEQFFGSFMKRQQFMQATKFWSHVDPLNLKWKIPFKQQVQEQQLQTLQNEDQKADSILKIGTLENVVISSDKQNRLHSRKLILKLRRNPYFTYGDVYLKEHDLEDKVDLLNLAYIFWKIREKMSQKNGEYQFFVNKSQQQKFMKKKDLI